MAMFLLGCGRPSDEDLIEAASLYKEGNAETEKKLADMFMQRIEKDKFDKKFIFYHYTFFIFNPFQKINLHSIFIEQKHVYLKP